MNEQIRQLLHLEYFAELDILGDSISDALSSGDGGSMHRMVKRILMLKRKPNLKVKRVVDATGKPCANIYQERQAFRAHFAVVLSVSEFSFAQLIYDVRETCSEGRFERPRACDIAVVYRSIPQLEVEFKHENHRKIIGNHRKIIGKYRKFIGTLMFFLGILISFGYLLINYWFNLVS